MANYPCGVYRITGVWHYTPQRGFRSAPVDETVNAKSMRTSAGGSAGETEIRWTDCSGIEKSVNNGYGWVHNASISQIGPCPCTSGYDCVNGKCELAFKYNTPGLYPTLEECQQVCASGNVCEEGKTCVDPNTYCPPGKVCLEGGEYLEIISKIESIHWLIC